MRLASFIAVCAGALLALAQQCAPRPEAGAKSGATGVVYLGELVEVRLGEWVTKNEPPPRLPQPLVYEVRRAAGDELLFTAKAAPPDGRTAPEWQESAPLAAGDAFAVNYCAVSFERGPQSRTASEQEWRQARPVLHSRHVVGADAAGERGPRGVRFRGREFEKSGESWGETAALASPSRRWLAVFSYTVKTAPAGVASGEFFWDVYDTSTGARVLDGYAPFGSAAPARQFSAAMWVEDSYLVMPLESSLDACLVGVMPAN